MALWSDFDFVINPNSLSSEEKNAVEDMRKKWSRSKLKLIFKKNIINNEKNNYSSVI